MEENQLKKAMDRIKVAKNFYLDEFLDPRTYFYAENNGLNLINGSLFKIAQKLREKYGKPIYINNWWWYFNMHKEGCNIPNIIEDIEYMNKQGEFNIWSGYRSRECEIGALFSAHRYGMAIDPKGDENKMYEIISGNRKEFYNLGVRRLEDISITPGWLHIDILERNTKPDSIRVVDLRTSTKTLHC